MPPDLLRSRAQTLRTHQTDAERGLWRALRGRQFEGYKFRRQRPLGRYIVDFVCLEWGLIVEVDGAHHVDQARYDRARDEYLRDAGFTVLRFTDREALTELEGVTRAILHELESTPRPRRRLAR